MRVAVSDACGSVYGRQGGQVSVYEIDEERWKTICSEQDAPMERLRMLREEGEVINTVCPDDILPV